MQVHWSDASITTIIYEQFLYNEHACKAMNKNSV